MTKIISAFEPGSAYGGGVVTQRLFQMYACDNFLSETRKNQEPKLLRALRTLALWARCPWLHPIFCAFSGTPGRGDTLLNFSQTFNLVSRYPSQRFSVVAHDVIVQKRMRFNWWIKLSERSLFTQAEKIFVLSEKDCKLIRRFYKIDGSKVINLFAKLFPELQCFECVVPRRGKYQAVFIGSLKRPENLRGFEWFYDNIYSRCREFLDVKCIGELDASLARRFEGVRFLGYVEDLFGEIRKADLSVAPVIDGAGIKIKVVDALSNKIPVIGTPKAFEGLGRPNAPYCSSDPEDWVRAIKSDAISFKYALPFSKESLHR